MNRFSVPYSLGPLTSAGNFPPPDSFELTEPSRGPPYIPQPAKIIGSEPSQVTVLSRRRCDCRDSSPRLLFSGNQRTSSRRDPPIRNRGSSPRSVPSRVTVSTPGSRGSPRRGRAPCDCRLPRNISRRFSAVADWVDNHICEEQTRRRSRSRSLETPEAPRRRASSSPRGSHRKSRQSSRRRSSSSSSHSSSDSVDSTGSSDSEDEHPSNPRYKGSYQYQFAPRRRTMN